MKIGIIGITGRMGNMMSELLSDDERSGGSSSKTSRDELMQIIENSDALVDFSTPCSTLKAIEFAAQRRTPVVSGTTGLSEKNQEQIKEFSKVIPILHASNFSFGVHLMAAMIKKCAAALPDFDFAIIDKHHNRKKDAPSGTALFLAKQVSKKAQIVSLREGNIFGEHICDFAGENEMISISHQVFNRKIFAIGALKCARWIVDKSPKLYSMQDYIDDATRRCPE
jgi:4-hydroxy-tetrahydrodipicolinate reductase